ncbi:universal stress protein [Natronorubrum texcoconense]|uniref:Nucleotide-binding universal stress protein, UspA family n=1 Tax=Natronorubrum texcoconense TaxID=1095776 RepID=A0A1G9BJF5_9EURY|nr:universal stress protein [Natronorubrum texcoconense]SDK39612.1 Nucleotide-binding universal stress protein, UspA family [Natronorubrum texcoconense]
MTILVAYDGSAPAQKAVKRAFDEYADEEIVLLRVVDVADGYTEASIKAVHELLTDRRETAAEKLRADLPEIVDTADVDFRTETATGDPAREIVTFAEEHDVDHIIVGSHGREGVSRVLLGSVAERVVRRAPVSVTVVR